MSTAKKDLEEFGLLEPGEEKLRRSWCRSWTDFTTLNSYRFTVQSCSRLDDLCVLVHVSGTQIPLLSFVVIDPSGEKYAVLHQNVVDKYNTAITFVKPYLPGEIFQVGGWIDGLSERI